MNEGWPSEKFRLSGVATRIFKSDGADSSVWMNQLRCLSDSELF